MSGIKIVVMAGIAIADKLQYPKSMFEKNESFKISLIKELKNRGVDESSYLIIIGDFTKNGAPIQYKFAAATIKDISSKLRIKRENIMFIPGRADINYSLLETKIGNGELKDPISMENKLSQFSDFYNEFFKGVKRFEPSKTIWDQIVIPKHGTKILAVNTLTKYSYDYAKGKGHIDNSMLDKELPSDQVANTDFKILFGYNGFRGDEENRIDNTSEIEATLAYKNVHVFLNRVKEVEALSKENSDINYYIGISDVGGDKPYFLIMESEEGGFALKYYSYQEQNKVESYWNEDGNNPNVIKHIPIHSLSGVEALSQDLSEDELQDAVPKIEPERKDGLTCTGDCLGYKEENEAINRYLIKIIRKNKLFMSGHFHWSKDGRSLSFIKTEFFFENYDCLERVKILYKKMIEDYELLKDPVTAQEGGNNHKCLVVGYAMPGVLVGIQLATYYKVPFSYIPAFIKYHTEDETEIPNDEFDTVTVIIDMVYKSHIIDWIIRRLIEKEKIKNSLKRVNIVTLFWGGGDEFKSSKLKINREKVKNNEEPFSVKMYYVNKFTLDKCTYRNKKECPVYCKKIAPVHVLSSED